MKLSNSKLGRMLVLGGLLSAYPAIGVSQQVPAPDNTKTNSTTGDSTADRQSNSQTDVDLTKSVRRAITEDKTLSTYARNVKVITQNGQVTLKGPVRSEEEKQAIEAKASEIAGKGNVIDELTVAQPKQ